MPQDRAPAAGETVGRRRERDRALDLLARGREHGVVICIAGEAGIGKSRLAEEVSAEGLRLGRLVLTGHATPIGRGAPYGILEAPVRQAQAAGRVFHDPLAALLADLVLPERRGDATAPPDPGAIGEAATRWIREAAAGAGVVLLLEDLHWAAPSSLALVTLLASAVQGAPVTLCLTYRPDEDPEGALAALRREVARRRLGEEIHLGPLPAADVVALTEATLGTAPDADAALEIVRLAGGNPFVVEEIVRDAVATGRLDAATGRWRSEREGPLPWSLRDMMASRLGRVAGEDHEVLRWAAVLGDRFDVPILAVASGMGDDAVLAALGRLRAAGLVTEDRDDLTGRRMAFHHALIRVAVDEEILPPDRRRRHAAILAAADDDPDALPLDQRLAHAVGAGERPRIVALSLAAARRATSIGVVADALGHYTRADGAWRPADDPAGHAALLLEWGQACETLQVDEAAAILERAAAEFDVLGDPTGRVMAQVGALHARWRRGEAGIDERMRDLLAALPPDAPPQAAITVTSHLARILIGQQGGGPEAAARARDALLLLDHLPPHPRARERSRMENVLGVVALEEGLVAEGRAHLEASARFAREAADPVREVTATGNLGTLGIWDAGPHLDEVLRVNDEARRVAVRAGLVTYEGWLLLIAASANLRAGRADAAHALLGAADATIAGGGGARDDIAFILLGAEHALAVGDVPGARAAWQDGLVRTLAAEDEQQRDARHGLARCDLAEGRPREAAAHLDPWIAGLRERPRLSGSYGSVALTWVAAALLAGRQDEAREISSLLTEHAPGPRADHAAALLRADAGAAADSCAAVAATGRVWEAGRMALWASGAILPDDRDGAARLAADALALLRGVGLDAWAERAETAVRAAGRRVTAARRAGGKDGLTKRERDVLTHICRGETNREIADALIVSEATVATHVVNLLRKLGAANRTEAARIAAERGLAGG